MVSIIDVLSSEAFWVAIGSIGSFIALVFIYFQIKISRMVEAANFLFKSEDLFNSQHMQKRRSELAVLIRNQPIDVKVIDSNVGALEVIDFFENMGLLVRKKIIPLEFVWSAYFYWITNYWMALQNYVEWYRKNNEEPTYYCELEYLYFEVTRFEERTRHKRVKITPNQFADFAEEEANLVI